MTSLATPPVTGAVPDRLEFRFLWNAAEHRRLYKAVRRAVWRRAWYRRLLPVAVGSIVVAEAAVLAVSPVPLSRVASGSSPYLVLIAFWFVLIRWGLPYLSARTYARGHQRCIPHDQVRVVTAEGIEAQCVTTNVTIRWSGVTRLIETPEFFLVFTGPNCAFGIPKRAVPDAESLRALRGVFVGALGPGAELLAT
jgi:YcxB-like protein